ncbi:Homoserine O-acetyltransferase [Wickerhamomyces ciferrii]|uniref:Homoserine O-acetyltransferase n=1 Tax=Wickerhamomyces ciferrii (strain ATCC 14091 / BCRC 22168 / CBS 111 / JCM 3599 / NBRC 0793 / NRRL Y-1031 F-60-10) TaxID=1206466 RepID=K0K7T3_WICCF|nr:Homoserine O-acetyltransferase [Wickerhamomyces ciferrii]CCH40875.1 Homoserine O-acetyltransferase [Wickerhamomyces ciferrii]
MLRSSIYQSSRLEATRALNKIVSSYLQTASYSTRSSSQRKLHNISNDSVSSSNPAMDFPCLDKLQAKTDLLSSNNKTIPSIKSEIDTNQGPEPVYSRVQSGFQKYQSKDPLFLDYGGFLPKFEIAYEQWGELNSDKSNAILLHTGLSASSHAKSQPDNTKPGWWENFIGPDLPLDTNKYFIVCTNVIGGCYGSTGPSSIDPSDNKHYATRFPILSVNDMVRAQERLMREQFGVEKLYASVGSSMGGMQSLAYAQEFPDSVEKIISISGCARSHPYSIAMRHAQRQVLMSDPNWKRGFYYDSIPPHVGMKLSREIATVTYRSGPEWEIRFGRERANPDVKPGLCPDFLVETYLDHQGNKFSLEYDPNSLLYISKAMDLFDLGKANRNAAEKKRLEFQKAFEDESNLEITSSGPACSTSSVPDENYKVKPRTKTITWEESEKDLLDGLSNFSNKEVLVIGVKSDILFPHWQQLEIANKLKEGNQKVFGGDGSNIKHVELGEDISMFGHDTFLLDVENIGGPVKKFLN